MSDTLITLEQLDTLTGRVEAYRDVYLSNRAHSLDITQKVATELRLLDKASQSKIDTLLIKLEASLKNTHLVKELLEEAKTQRRVLTRQINK